MLDDDCTQGFPLALGGKDAPPSSGSPGRTTRLHMDVAPAADVTI